MLKDIKFRVTILALVLFSCVTSKKTNTASSDLLNNIVAEKSFDIKLQFAQPRTTSSYNKVANAGLLPPGSSAGQVNITGNTSYFKVKNDSVFAHLPYFGERFMGSGYGNGDGSIEFEGIAKNIEIINNKTGSYNMNFSINDKKNTTENYNVFVKLYNNQNASIIINSSQRSGIRYSGNLKSNHKK